MAERTVNISFEIDTETGLVTLQGALVPLLKIPPEDIANEDYIVLQQRIADELVSAFF